VLAHLPHGDEAEVEELRHAYRVPAEIMELALPLLALIAPEAAPPIAFRTGAAPPRIRRIASEELVPEALREAAALAGEEGLVAVVAPSSLRGEGSTASLFDETRVPLLTPREAKGLEFDHVVVVEPALIAVEEQGLRGLKLWMACHCDDPRVFPIVEQAVAYRLPILIHAWSKVGGSLPTESEADHVAALARRFPEARIVMAHMSGDWLVKLRLIRDCPNVHVDTSGIDPEEGQVETAVAMLGASRVLYGSDAPIRDLGSQIAKVLGAELDEEARRLVLHGNVERLLEGGAR
jgi:hypothetical protein